MMAGFALFRLLMVVAMIAMGGVTASHAMSDPAPGAVASALAGPVVGAAALTGHDESCAGNIGEQGCPPSDTQACYHSLASGCYAPALSVERMQVMTMSATDNIRLHRTDTAADGTDPEAAKKPPKTLV